MKIQSTKKVYLDGEEYIRVFFEDSQYFEDIPAENYEAWKDAWDHDAAQTQ